MRYDRQPDFTQNRIGEDHYIKTVCVRLQELANRWSLGGAGIVFLQSDQHICGVSNFETVPAHRQIGKLERAIVLGSAGDGLAGASVLVFLVPSVRCY